MRRGYGCAIFLTVLIACMGATGCGGGSGTTIPPLKITTTSLPSGVVGSPYSATLSATGGTPSYTWSQVSGGDLPAGLSLGNAGVFSGTPTTAGTYGPYVFKAADSNSLVAQTIPLSLVITTNTLSVTTTSLPSGTVGASYSVTLAATGGTPPYTWRQNAGGALPPGIATITSAGILTGTPTAAGTFGPYVFSVIDSTNQASQSTNLFFTISTAQAAACKALGGEGALIASTPYAFLLQGRDGTGRPLDIAGSFTPDGAGNLTNATVDYNGFINGPQQMQVDLTQSSYAFSSTTNQGCLSLVFTSASADSISARHEGKSPNFVHGPAVPAPSGNAVPAAASSVSSVLFAFGLGGFDGQLYHTGRIIENDNTGGGTNASGLIHLQTPSTFSIASLQQNYAFGFDGWTADNTGFLRTVLAGSFANSSGSLSNGVADMNVQGTASGQLPPPPPPPPALPLPAGYGTLNSAIDSATGRGTGTYNITSPAGVLTFDFAFYVLNGSDLLAISTDSPIAVGSAPLLSGRALATSASFPASALNGYYLMSFQGIEVGPKNVGNYTAVGTMNATSTGTIPTATLYVNNSGAFTNNPYTGASYTTEAASGRSPISGFTLTSPIAYLTAPGSDDGIAGFLVGTDTNSSSGQLVLQSTGAPAFTLSSVTGNYAASTNEDVDGLNGASFGVFSFSGTGTFTATQFVTGQVVAITSPGTITVNADGSGTLNGTKMSLVTNGSTIYAIPNSGDPLVYVFVAPGTPE